MAKKIIAVDIDDVLSLSAEGFAQFSNDRWGMQLTVDDYDEDFAKAWGVPLEQAKLMAESFLSSGIHAEYAHFEEAVPVLRKLGQKFHLIVVTSRRQRLKPETEAWIDRHYKNIFKDVVYAGFFDDAENAHKQLHQTKAQLCLDLQADFLIDDQPKHCLAAAECGMRALLFGNYPWNRHLENSRNLTVVSSWQAVEQYFAGKT